MLVCLGKSLRDKFFLCNQIINTTSRLGQLYYKASKFKIVCRVRYSFEENLKNEV